jgi:hypothetical protein
MPTPDGFRQYAKECLQWADEAKSEDEQSYLAMAKDWTLAVLRLDGTDADPTRFLRNHEWANGAQARVHRSKRLF